MFTAPSHIPVHLANLFDMKTHRHYRGGFNSTGMLTSARELRTNATQAESCLWSKLRNRQLYGFKFRRQHQFGNYIADFYCHEAQLVVGVTGRYTEPMRIGTTIKHATFTWLVRDYEYCDLRIRRCFTTLTQYCRRLRGS